MSKITYTNKVALYENSDIADINKVKADDMNEIKACVNNNDDMLTGGAVAGDMVVNSIKTKNVFDKSNIIYNSYISVGNGKVDYSATARCVFAKIESGKTYTISKIQSSRFAVGLSTTIPEVNTPLTNIWQVNEATNYTITAGASDKYVVLYIYNQPSDTLTFQQIIDTIQVEEGSSVTNYRAFQDLNPNISGLDNNGSNYGGLAKRSVVSNTTTFTVYDPNYQNTSILRNAIVTCGDSGIMLIRWSGNNSSAARIVWNYLIDGKTCTFAHDSGVLSFTFSATIYGGINVLFMN